MPIKLAKEKLGTVKSAMSEVACVIDHDSTVAQAVRTLSELRVTGAPVMRGERVVGVVSQSDLLRARDDTDSVEAVMTETVYAVRPDDPLLLAVRLMLEQRIHRVIVVNEMGQLYGVVSAMDVLRALTNDTDDAGGLTYLDLRQLAVATAPNREALLNRS